jgi:hypothetical protein
VAGRLTVWRCAQGGRLADERRYDVPVVLICPEFTPAQAREWIDQGGVPELAKSKAHDQRAGRSRTLAVAGG